MTTIELDYQRPKSERKKGTCRILLRQAGKTKATPVSVKIYTHEWDDKTKGIRTEAAATPSRLKELLRSKTLLAEETALLTEIVLRIESGKKVPSNRIFAEILRQRDRCLLERSLFSFLEYRIVRLRETGRDSTAENYRSALNCFREFRKKKDLPLSDLTCNIMKDFQHYMQRKGLAMNTISLYNRNLRAAYNYALDDGLLNENHRPFCKVFTGRERTRKRAVKENIVKRLIAEPLAGQLELAFARDLFLFCIYAQGMAFVDVSRLTEANLSGKRLTYKRSKTGRKLEMELPECALQIIGRYREAGNSYLFPILYSKKTDRATSYQTALREYNKRLHRLSDRIGLEKPLSSYVARHTWASLAKWNGVNDTIISEAMGHTNVATTTIYLASLDTDAISAANHTIIASLMKRS